MGNAVRGKPNKSKESAYNGSNFGGELESRSAPYGSVELSECCKIGRFTNRLALGKNS